MSAGPRSQWHPSGGGTHCKSRLIMTVTMRTPACGPIAVKIKIDCLIVDLTSPPTSIWQRRRLQAITVIKTLDALTEHFKLIQSSSADEHPCSAMLAADQHLLSSGRAWLQCADQRKIASGSSTTTAAVAAAAAVAHRKGNKRTDHCVYASFQEVWS